MRVSQYCVEVRSNVARYAKDAPVSDLTRFLGKNLNYTFLYKKNSCKKHSPSYVSLSSKKHFITFFTYKKILSFCPIFLQIQYLPLPYFVFTTPCI